MRRRRQWRRGQGAGYHPHHLPAGTLPFYTHLPLLPTLTHMPHTACHACLHTLPACMASSILNHHPLPCLTHPPAVIFALMPFCLPAKLPCEQTTGDIDRHSCVAITCSNVCVMRVKTGSSPPSPSPLLSHLTLFSFSSHLILLSPST